MRIALVNDLNLALAALRCVVDSMPDAEIAWVALNGREAVEKCRLDRPDLILMDLVMPVLDGVQATRQIMEQCPCAILITTATVSGNSSMVFDALGSGAVDAVETPAIGRDANLKAAEPLLRKIRQVVRIADWKPKPEVAGHCAKSTHSSDVNTPPLVVIGSSTGGPKALQVVLSQLERDCSVVIVQHLEVGYTAGLADWLTSATPWPTHLALAGDVPLSGHAHLASGVDHLVLNQGGRFAYVSEPTDHLHKPSIDVFFCSLCHSPVARGAAVLLTGMGRDGVLGLKQLKERGWFTIAQDQESSVVWGMPGAAVRDGVVSHVVPLNELGTTISRLLKQPPKGQRN